MKKFFLNAFLILIVSVSIQAQDFGFPFGGTYKDLDFTPMERDSSAEAIVLQEFGEAYVDNGGHNNIIFEYHTRIKIFSKPGLKYADVEIPMYKGETSREQIHMIKAASYTMENGSMKE